MYIHSKIVLGPSLSFSQIGSKHRRTVNEFRVTR
jgi:hypothetical protein